MNRFLRGLHEPDGSKLSISRCVLVLATAVVFPIWLVIGGLIFLDMATWQEYAGWMKWMTSSYLGSVAPYAINRAAGAVSRFRGTHPSHGKSVSGHGADGSAKPKPPSDLDY